MFLYLGQGDVTSASMRHQCASVMKWRTESGAATSSLLPLHHLSSERDCAHLPKRDGCAKRKTFGVVNTSLAATLLVALLLLLGILLHDTCRLLTRTALPWSGVELREVVVGLPSGAGVEVEAELSVENRMILTGARLESFECDLHAPHEQLLARYGVDNEVTVPPNKRTRVAFKTTTRSLDVTLLREYLMSQGFSAGDLELLCHARIALEVAGLVIFRSGVSGTEASLPPMSHTTAQPSSQSHRRGEFDNAVLGWNLTLGYTYMADQRSAPHVPAPDPQEWLHIWHQMASHLERLAVRISPVLLEAMAQQPAGPSDALHLTVGVDAVEGRFPDAQ
ncbi:hypothetical protein CYMTET_47894 [Cymbomonas tetramitiformis]|uniref:Uncharacterized protein n=1 Tax=Cymbomonas tetramitiformis TaxID=36881 RepID=A0AAE0BV81_9CHLO|nr:hypothetical protein CYMTET_47894 [Cymbomonas tetramitiformis]